MAKTVVGLFDNSRAAQSAVLELVNSGIPREAIGITSRDYTTGDRSTSGSDYDRGDLDSDEGIGERISNFFSSLFGTEDDASYYSDAVSRGGTVVTVDAETDDLADRTSAVHHR